jgi:hypothetical protein
MRWKMAVNLIESPAISYLSLDLSTRKGNGWGNIAAGIPSLFWR